MTIPSGGRRRTGCRGDCTAFGEFGHAHGVRAARGDERRFTYTRSHGPVSGQCGRLCRGADRSGERSQKQKAGAVVTRTRVGFPNNGRPLCLAWFRLKKVKKVFDPLAASSSLSLSVPSLLTYSRQFTLFLTLYSLATLRQSTSIPLATRRNNVTSTPFSYPAPRKYKPDNPGIFTLPTSSHYRLPLDIIDNHTLLDSQHSTRFDPAWPSVRFINIASFINYSRLSTIPLPIP
jgi:hypothetical protein